jgi:CHAT domain-containing protein
MRERAKIGSKRATGNRGRARGLAFCILFATMPWQSFASPAEPARARIEELIAVAEIYIENGEADRGKESAEEALAASREVGDSSLVARSLQQIGNAHFYSNHYDLALESFLSSLAVAREAGDRRGQAHALKDAGITLRTMERFDEALEHLHAALELFTRLDNGEQVISVLISLGGCYAALGALRLAIDSYEQALARSRAGGYTNLTMHSLLRLGYLSVDLDEPALSLAYFNEALAMAESAGLPRDQAWILMGLSDPLASLGRREEAARANRRSMELSRQIKNQVGVAHNLSNLGHLNVEAAPRAAISYYQSALDIYRRYNSRVVWAPYEGIARAYWRLGERERAIEYFEMAIGQIEMVRGQLVSDEHRSSFLGKYQDTYHGLIELLIEQQERKGVGASRAYTIYEKTRASSMLEAILSARPDSAEHLDEDLRQRDKEINARIAELQNRLINGLAPLERRRIIEQLSQAERDYDRLCLDIKRRNPRYAARPAALTPEMVQSFLDDQTAVVAYLITKRHAFAFIVARQSFQVMRLSATPELIAARVENYVDLIARESGDGWRDISRRLYDELLAPVRGHIPEEVRNLIIVPDGALHYLPFETLDVSGKYLIEEFAVSYAPSAAVLAELGARNDQETGQDRADIALFADPELRPAMLAENGANSSGGWMRALYVDEGLQISPIPSSAAEARAVARYADGASEIYTGPKASERRVKSERLDRFRIIHFATHGLVSHQSPARSALVLSSGEEGEDGFLQAREIYNLRLASDLVVLSACQTARGRVLAGEGVEGLARAFLYAGARSVVASLWDVNDEQATRFMESFYRYLSEGKSKSEALRAAKLDFLNGAPSAAPRDWAAFVLIGDASRKVAIGAGKSGSRPWLLLGVLTLPLAALVVAFIYRIRTKRRATTARPERDSILKPGFR